MTGFTPPPWFYDATVTVAPKDLPCVTDKHRLVVATTLDDGRSEEECEANTHLIAAAPELYEITLELLQASVVGGQTDDERDALEAKARAVIAKARGEQFHKERTVSNGRPSDHGNEA